MLQIRSILKAIPHKDCAFIANALANGNAESLSDTADYNMDGKKNVRDAAALSKDLASK